MATERFYPGTLANQQSIIAKVEAVDAAVRSLTPSENYPGTAHVTFAISSDSYAPSAAVAAQMLADAYVLLIIGNNKVKYQLTSIAPGTSVATLVSVSGSANAFVEFHCPTIVDEQVLCTRQFIHIVEGGTYTVSLKLRKANESYFAIGRGQIVADTTTMTSFLFTRDGSSGDYSPVTLFGHYETDGTTTPIWVNDTGVEDAHPTIDGATVTGEEGDFETRIFPWKDVEKRTVTSGYTDGTANNQYLFSWCPLYYWRMEDVELPVRTHNYVTDTDTTVNKTFRIHWISKTQLPGFSLPPWAYVWARGTDGTWSKAGVKDGFYYARYDSLTKNNKIQSHPWNAMNDGITRARATELCHNLNTFTSTVTGGTANNAFYSTDPTNRLWAAPMYENYAPWRELAYIQFGASMKSVFYGGQRINLDAIEAEIQAAGSIKSFVCGGNHAGSFVWLNIWNPFYGSEGAVMSDASYVAGKDANGVNYGEWWVCPDRACDIGGCTTVEALEAAGAFPLAYRYGGAGVTASEPARCIDETSTQASIYWFPGNTSAKCSVRVTDESGWYGGAPSEAGAKNVYGNWLSRYRGDATQLGLWFVGASDAPSVAYAGYWGSRPSFAPVRAEGEARSEG